MNVRDVTVTDSPEGGGRARLTAEVAYDDGRMPPERYWFEVPAPCVEGLARRADPWLVALLPLAVTLGEPLRVAGTVDSRLFSNLHRVMQVWAAWYPGVSGVSIEADLAPDDDVAGAPRTAAFFSGGVDSFFTALRPGSDGAPAESLPLDDLITVWGFDVPLAREEAGRRLRDRLGKAAAALERGFVDVVTNIRATRLASAPWGPLAHGCALAAVAHLLGTRYGRVLIAATGGYRDLHPWGSHPLTDPLLSSRTTAVVHDGAAFTRVEKTAVLADSPVALRTLRVCWRSESDQNCGACGKCYRAMLILELLGALHRCATFPRGALDLRRAARVYCAESWDFREVRDIEALAVARGRADIARAARRAMRRSRRLAPALLLTQALRRRAALAGWGMRLERQLLAGWAR